jgi:hypothetical protein
MTKKLKSVPIDADHNADWQHGKSGKKKRIPLKRQTQVKKQQERLQDSKF